MDIDICIHIRRHTLWLFNVAMEAMAHLLMVYHDLSFVKMMISIASRQITRG